MARDPRRFRLRREQYPWQQPGKRDEELISQRLNDFLRELQEVKIETTDLSVSGASSGDILVASAVASGEIQFLPQKWVPRLGIGTSGDPTWNFEASGGTLHVFLRDTTFGGFRGLWLDKTAAEDQRVGLRLASGGTGKWEVSFASGGNFQVRSILTSVNVLNITPSGTTAFSGDVQGASSIILSGTPEASATRARLQLGSPPNVGPSGGTWFIINGPSGNTADLFRIDIGDSNRWKIGSGAALLGRQIDAGMGTSANGIDLLNTTSGVGVGIRLGNTETGNDNVWQVYAKGSSDNLAFGRSVIRDNLLIRGASAGIYVPSENAGTTAPSGTYLLQVGSAATGFIVDNTGDVTVKSNLGVGGNATVTGNISSAAQVSGATAYLGTASGLTINATGQFAFDGKAVGSPQTYTETNVTTDRTFDANSTSLDEIADVLGTLIGDLRNKGIVR